MRHLSFSLIVFYLVIGVTSGFAQDKVQGIIVELNSGKKIEYRLVDHPKLLFDGNKITLTTDEVMVEYTPVDLKKVMTGEVDNIETDIQELPLSQGNIKVESGFVQLSGFDVGETVRVYSVNGGLTASYKTGSEGSLVISISSLPSGISIIKTINQSIKITKR